MTTLPSPARAGLMLLLAAGLAASAQAHGLVAYIENQHGGFAKLWDAYVAYDSGHYVAENGIYVEEAERRSLVPWEHVLLLALERPGEPTRWSLELRDGTRRIDYYSRNLRDGRIYLHGTNRYGVRDAYMVDPVDWETHGIVAIHLRREEGAPQDATELSEVTAAHPLADGVYLLNNDVVEGRILNRNFHLRTSYADLTFSSPEIAEIRVSGSDEMPDEIRLRTGEKLTGVLQTRNVVVETEGGRELVLLLPDLARLAFRSR